MVAPFNPDRRFATKCLRHHGVQHIKKASSEQANGPIKMIYGETQAPRQTAYRPSAAQHSACRGIAHGRWHFCNFSARSLRAALAPNRRRRSARCSRPGERSDGRVRLPLSSRRGQAKGATPYDIKGVEFEHHGDSCSFDAIVSINDIKAPALDQLTNVVGFSRKLSPPATMPIHSNGVVP